MYQGKNSYQRTGRTGWGSGSPERDAPVAKQADPLDDALQFDPRSDEFRSKFKIAKLAKMGEKVCTARPTGALIPPRQDPTSCCKPVRRYGESVREMVSVHHMKMLKAFRPVIKLFFNVKFSFFLLQRNKYVILTVKKDGEKFEVSGPMSQKNIQVS